jgi:hypothetical protein
MSARREFAYPREVWACAIRNDSDTDVKVVLIYRKVQRPGEEVKQKRFELNIVKGKTGYVGEKLYSMGMAYSHEVIETIEVTRADGKKLTLTEPFDGVTKPVVDWLFSFDDTEIKSVGSNS